MGSMLDESDPGFRLEATATALCGFTYPNHFRQWARLIEEKKRLLVIASRDMGKSTLFDIILPITRVCSNPGYRVLLVSYSDSQVLKIGAKIKDFFESRPKLKEFSPKSQDDWSKSRMLFKDGSLIETLTFGSSGRGGHYSLILVDDPVKDFGGMAPEDQSQYFTRALTPMCDPDGQIIVTGSYVFDGDLIDRIEKNTAYHTAKFPAINSDGTPLWPERWPLDKLAERRKEIESSDDPLGFMKEYLLEKVDAKSQFFKRSMFKFYEPEKVPERLSLVASLDPALSLDGDDCAFMLTGTAEDKRSYLLDYFAVKTDDISKIVELVFDKMAARSAPYLQVETIGFQKLFKHWFYEEMRRRDFYFGIEEIKTHKKSKEARIMALQPRIESGSLLFHPKAHEAIISQFLAFPRGQHDDMIDALSFQIGKWDNPGPLQIPAPKNSFDWWREQAKPIEGTWQEALRLT